MVRYYSYTIGDKMKILRAGFSDTDIFTEKELSFGGCCFFSEDKTYKYFFQINKRKATLFSDTNKYIDQVISEFLFYSGFVSEIKNKDGKILATNNKCNPYLHKILDIQPSQFYINEQKLKTCKNWITDIEDIMIPIAVRAGKVISLDGHTRLRAAMDLGYDMIYVYTCEFDEVVFCFADEAVKRKIFCVDDMEIVSSQIYKQKWDKYCDDFFTNYK